MLRTTCIKRHLANIDQLLAGGAICGHVAAMFIAGGAASSDEEDDGFIRNDDEADDEGATVAAAAAGKGAVSKMEGGGGIGGGKPAEKGKLARSGVGGVRGSVADGEGDYGEDSFDAEDEAEMAEALM